MNIRILTVGKVKEKFYRDAISEYSKRLSRYVKLEVVEVGDEQTPDNASEVVCAQIKDKEGDRILRFIKPEDYVVTLEIKGKKLDSVAFSDFIDKLGITGKSTIDFVIGGSLGLSEKVSSRADYKLSFSDMTFPHQLMRVVLLEQIYRAQRIIHNEPYHK